MLFKAKDATFLVDATRTSSQESFEDLDDKLQEAFDEYLSDVGMSDEVSSCFSIQRNPCQSPPAAELR